VTDGTFSTKLDTDQMTNSDEICRRQPGGAEQQRVDGVQQH
jgi:hypothetical protein